MKTNFIVYYMNMEKPFIFLFLLVRFFAVIFCDGEFCEVSSASYALIGHSFKVVPVYSRMECIQRCAIHDQCVSVNVRSLTASMLCELNDKTREAYPGDFKERKRSTYFEILRETFDKQSESICASGLYCGYAVAKCGVYDCRCMGSASAAQSVGFSSTPSPPTGLIGIQSTSALLGTPSFSAVLMTSSVVSIQVTPTSRPDCNQALGLENTTIPGDQISASSGVAWKGRLNNLRGAWAPTKSDQREWLQVRFLSSTNITAVATQGCSNPKGWVQKYTVEYSQTNCTVSWTEYPGTGGVPRKVFVGNNNEKGIIKNKMDPPFIATCVRIRPQNWSHRIALRIELYGCTL